MPGRLHCKIETLSITTKVCASLVGSTVAGDVCVTATAVRTASSSKVRGSSLPTYASASMYCSWPDEVYCERGMPWVSWRTYRFSRNAVPMREAIGMAVDPHHALLAALECGQNVVHKNKGTRRIQCVRDVDMSVDGGEDRGTLVVRPQSQQRLKREHKEQMA